MNEPRMLSVAELATALGEPLAREQLSWAHGIPAVVVDLRRSEAFDAMPIGMALGSLPCIVVGVGGAPGVTPPTWVDLVIDEETQPAEASRRGVLAAEAQAGGETESAALAEMWATIERAPIAAVSLAVLLRQGSGDVAAGLAAESAVYSMLQAGPEFARWRQSRPAHQSGSASQEPASAVRLERSDDSLTIRLARPHRHNAIDSAMRDGLCEALQVASADSSIERVVLRGDGPSFCSGGDLDSFGTFTDPASAHLVRLTRSPATLMATVAERTEVYLHGAAMGGGIELAAFARRVVAHPDTRIALPEVPLGLIPGAGGTVSIPARIGRHRTLLLALLGRPIDAPTALAWGLIDEIDSAPESASTA